MITAMIKLPDGKVINKILAQDGEEESAIKTKMIDCPNGAVLLMFDNTSYTTHWSNVCLICKRDTAQSEGLVLKTSQ